MILLPSQGDEIFDLITNAELSPIQFHLKEAIGKIDPTKISTYAIFKNSPYYFSFETNPRNRTSHCSNFCPGSDTYIEIDYPGSWAIQKGVFKRWLTNLKREITTTNKWALLEKEMQQINATYDNSTDTFSASEYDDLKQRMNQLKEGIKAIELLSEHLEILNAKIDHLTDLALTMNKFDWKSQFVGTVINLSMYLAFSEEARTAFWGLIKVVMSPIILLP